MSAYFVEEARPKMMQHTEPLLEDRAGTIGDQAHVNGLAALAPPSLSAAKGALVSAGPMIARKVSLTILVKNLAELRSTLDAIVARNHGYAAHLDMSMPESGPQSFQASLRIPTEDLNGALDQLRALGKVESESQSGEEVTQLHADLGARLTNARETEERLRAILQNRAGKMDEVLQVEEQIAETRAQIEQMEAEQAALEHRVSFATVDVQLTEKYQAHLGDGGDSIGSRLRNSFIAGIRNAGNSLMALALFVEEVGPTLVFWTLILGLPATLLLRRYRRARSRT